MAVEEPDKSEKSDKVKVSSRPNRCAICNKKLGLMGFLCKCDGIFCTAHRYSDAHNCSFDYKTQGKEQLAKSNPVVIPQKISTI